jgi:uncharacterized protein YciI
MWTRNHSKFYPNTSPEMIWKIWVDINNWPSWHGDLDYCKLEGDFKVGNHFILKPLGAPAVKIRLTDINEGQSFTDCTKFFGAKMVDTHSMQAKDGGVLLSNKLTVSGPLKWLWIKLVAKNVADTVPDEMDALARLAQADTLIVDLEYKKSLDEVVKHLQEHREFVDKYVNKGVITASGPKKPRTGGILIAKTDKETMEKIIQEDPFYKNGIASYKITVFKAR